MSGVQVGVTRHELRCACTPPRAHSSTPHLRRIVSAPCAVVGELRRRFPHIQTLPFSLSETLTSPNFVLARRLFFGCIKPDPPTRRPPPVLARSCVFMDSVERASREGRVAYSGQPAVRWDQSHWHVSSLLQDEVALQELVSEPAASALCLFVFAAVAVVAGVLLHRRRRMATSATHATAALV